MLVGGGGGREPPLEAFRFGEKSHTGYVEAQNILLRIDSSLVENPMSVRLWATFKFARSMWNIITHSTFPYGPIWVREGFRVLKRISLSPQLPQSRPRAKYETDLTRIAPAIQ